MKIINTLSVLAVSLGLTACVTSSVNGSYVDNSNVNSVIAKDLASKVADILPAAQTTIFLEDKSSEYFDAAMHILNKLSLKLSLAEFYNVLIKLLVTCGSRRQQIFLMMEKNLCNHLKNNHIIWQHILCGLVCGK